MFVCGNVCVCVHACVRACFNWLWLAIYYIRYVVFGICTNNWQGYLEITVLCRLLSGRQCMPSSTVIKKCTFLPYQVCWWYAGGMHA